MTIAYTLVNIKYLPVAKTMVDSFVEHNPDIPIYICLFDEKKDIQDSIFLEYNIYDKSNLNNEEYDSMRSRYDDMSMACALKPFFAEALIRDYNPDNIIYLDADMMFFSSIQHLSKLLLEPQNSIILTGHNYTLSEAHNNLTEYQNLRKYGLYNAGFLAIRINAESLSFLKWWREILFTKCIREDYNGIYYDQTWLDLAPIYFPNTFILKDIGYNVAYWNLKERTVSKKENQYYVNDNIPLVFYHFARFKYYEKEYIDGFKIRFDSYPVVQKIFSLYRKLLKENLYERFHPFLEPKKISFFQKLKISLKYRLSLIIEKL